MYLRKYNFTDNNLTISKSRYVAEIMLALIFAAITIYGYKKGLNVFMEHYYYSIQIAGLILDIIIGRDFTLLLTFKMDNIAFILNSLPFFAIYFLLLLINEVPFLLILKIIAGQFMVLYIWHYRDLYSEVKNKRRAYMIGIWLMLIVGIIFGVIEKFNEGDTLLIAFALIFVFVNIFNILNVKVKV